MPKVSARFRNRKINFRTRIPIHTGPLDTPSDDEDDEFAYENEQRHSIGGTATDRNNLVETGVDKEEESELHLQKVINASTAALLRSAVNDKKPASPGIVAELSNTATASNLAATQTSNAVNEPIVPHIPIPDAAGLVDPATYEALYGHSKIFLPSSYIRFSDTVEDTLHGVLYTMDEEDESWLNSFNSELSPSGEQTNKGTPLLDENGKMRRSRKGKEKERAGTELEGLGRLAEDDFEAIMDHFEKTTEETVPGLHLDTNRLPSLADLEFSLESPLISPRLSSIKIFAKSVYSHWKERRLKRGGKTIMPAIDFDETNESNPYVCFRRREVKMVRKTRRTDAQNMDRLIRLRNDLYKAQELLNAVLNRERTKREVVEVEKAIFEGRCQLREVKRSLNEVDGDEDLLVSKKEKRRKREQSGNGCSTIKSPLRNTAGPSPTGPASGGANIVEDVQFYRDQARASVKLMERDYNRYREEQNGWEDLTDSAQLPVALTAAALRWRGAATCDPHSTSKTSRENTTSFEQGPFTAPSVMENNQFRKRVGRGGRFFLDRIMAPHQRKHPVNRLKPESPNYMEETIHNKRIADRWRYDDDLRQDFPYADHAHIIDDYSIPYSSRRRKLLDLDDLDCLDPQGEVYLAKANEFFNRAPEPDPPVVKVGKLPGKTVPNLFGTGLARPNCSPVPLNNCKRG